MSRARILADYVSSGDELATVTTTANAATTTANAALPKAGGTMTGNIVMGDDTSIGIGDAAERIEFDGAGDISVLGANLGVGTDAPANVLTVAGGADDKGIELVDESGNERFKVVRDTAGNSGLKMYNASNAQKAQIHTAAASYFTGGNVGIGKSASIDAQLDINQTQTSGLGCRIYRDLASGSTDNAVCEMRNDNSGDDQNTLRVKTVCNSIAYYGFNYHASSTTANMQLLQTRSENSAYQFIQCYSGAGGDLEFLVRGDGYTAADGSFSGGGVDYAEYFESKTGETIPVGTTVKLDGDKVVACSESDTPIGVIRPQEGASVVGGSAWNKWNKKNLKDDYDGYIYEEYTQTEWKDDDGEFISYQTDKIPADLTVPADAVVTSEDEDGNKLMRRKLNPDYDESQTYIPRENRDEWVIVGLLGQIPITKGQPVADSWIKMKDVSETVEMWFVK